MADEFSGVLPGDLLLLEVLLDDFKSLLVDYNFRARQCSLQIDAAVAKIACEGRLWISARREIGGRVCPNGR